MGCVILCPIGTYQEQVGTFREQKATVQAREMLAFRLTVCFPLEVPLHDHG